MKPLTPITGAQLATLGHGTPLVTYGKPIREIMPKDVVGDGTGAREVVVKKEAWVVPTMGGAPGMGLGWPLPAKKVVLKRVKGVWVVD